MTFKRWYQGAASGLVLFLAIVFPATLPAQRVADLVQGTRVRVVSHERMTREGFFRSATSDSITIIANGAPLALSLGETVSVARFAVVNRGRDAMRLALIGGTVGALIGAGIGAKSFKPCESKGVYDCSRVPGTKRQATIFGSVIVGVSSFITGGLVGAVRGTESWAPVSLH
ncbi:MAG: hypothetical protein H0W69_06340 [Gemmatimonadaceae bacterium]|nr:hypothetical protein [Gemmatimonadaceae bacterium]